MQVATQISSVTVYRNGALVVRTGKGHGDVEVRGLPLLFSSETLRVRPERGSVARLEETVRLDAVPAPLPAPEEEHNKIVLEIQRVDDELRTCASLLEVLDGLNPELPDARAPVDGLVDAALFVDLVQFAGAEAKSVVARRQTLERRRRELERERHRIAARALAVPPEAPRVMRGARFLIEADGDVEFALEYFVHAARWVPTYALHLAGPSARLVTAALVAQATGEDWSGVRIGVSTADLARETTLPVLSSWRIGRAQPSTTKAFRPLPTDLPALFQGYDAAPRKLPPAAAPPQNRPRPEPKSGRFEQSADTGEVRSFEEERTNASVMALSAAQMEDMESGEAGADEEPMAEGAAGGAAFGVKTNTAMRFEPELSRAPSPPSAMPMPSMQAMGRGAMAPGGAVRESKKRAMAKEDSGGVTRAPHEELPQRFRTAYMRMAGPDEGQRGSLLPLDPTARLEWLLEAHDTDGAGRAELRRALYALEHAQGMLEHAPLPRGTSALLGTHFPSVMHAAAATDVPGDGTFYRVEVREDVGPATTEHKAVPRESNDVWRTCRLELAGAPLPPGPLAVYEDGAFKVNARLDTGAARVAGSGGVDVNLGVDPDVRVLSRTVHVNQSEKGIMTSTSRVEHRVKMELRSTRKEPASVVLYDRLPTAADNVKDVNVQVLEEKPPVKRTNKDAFGNEVPGAFEWRVVVMPGATQSLDFAYAIDLPAKTELEGGNRRE